MSRQRGTGTFHKRPGGLIQHRISIGFDAQGRRMRPVVYARTIAECRDLMARKIEEIRKLGGMRMPDDTTVGGWLDQWIARKKRDVESDALAPATLRQYDAAVSRHIRPYIGRIRLARLSVRDVDAWLTQLETDGVPSRTRQAARTTAVVAINDAMRLELVDRNVVALVAAPRHHRGELNVWDVDEATAFLKAAEKDRYAAFWWLWLTTGARPNELLGLRPEDVDLAAGSIAISEQLAHGGKSRRRTKTSNARRTIGLPPVAVAAVRAHLERRLAEGLRASPWLFATPSGTAVDYRNLSSRHFDAIVERAKVKRIRPYDLRHTFATLALKAGVPAHVVSEALGHADVRFTLQTYAHILTSMREDHVAKIELLFGAA